MFVFIRAMSSRLYVYLPNGRNNDYNQSKKAIISREFISISNKLFPSIYRYKCFPDVDKKSGSGSVVAMGKGSRCSRRKRRSKRSRGRRRRGDGD